MKKLNWKYAAAGRWIVLACATCLLLFTMSTQASPAKIKFGKELLKFDDISNYSAVPSGYGVLDWNNFYALDAVNYYDNPSGYEAGLKSANNVLFNSGGYPASISSSGYAFVLNSAYLTGAWNDNLQVQVQGYFLGKLVYTKTYTLSAVKPTLVTFPSQLVSEVVFTSFGGTYHSAYSPYSGEHFSTDNVTVTLLPIPVKVYGLVPNLELAPASAAPGDGAPRPRSQPLV